MTNKPPALDPATELQDLRARLAETEELLRAIRNGEVDAVMVAGEHGEQVYTLTGADRIYRRLVESMGEGTATVSANGIILYCNLRLAEILELPLDQLIGCALCKHLPSTDLPALDAILAQACTVPNRREINLQTAAGHLTPVYLSASRLHGAGAEAVLCLVFTDLTEQKTHEQLVAAECLARLILEQAGEAIVVCDEQGLVIRTSQEARRFCADDPLQRSFAEVFPLRTDAPDPFSLAPVLQGATQRDVDVLLECRGQELNLILNAGPLRKGDGIIGCVVALIDVTARRQTEVSLRQSRAAAVTTMEDAIASRQTAEKMTLKLQHEMVKNQRAQEVLRLHSAALNAASNSILITDRDGVIQWVNTAFTRSTGYDAGESIGRKPGDLLKSGEHDAAFYNLLWETIVAGQIWHGELINRRRDGTLYAEETAITPIKNDGGEITHFIAIKQDITEHKRDVDRLREQASLLDNARDAILVRDLDHRITYWNKSAERLYGWTAGEIIGRSITELLVPRELAAFQRACARVMERGEWVGEVQQIAKDCRELTVESRWTLMRDADGGPKSIMTINTDITEKKDQAAIWLRAQRLESLGTLAGGLAHDLNNALTPVLMGTQLLRTRCPDATDMIDVMETSAMRCAEMVRQLLTFAKGTSGERMVIQLRHLLKEMEGIISGTFPKNIVLRVDVARDCRTVVGDATQLHQVLLNLCVNARDSMPNGGTLTLAAANAEIDATYASGVPDARPGRYIVCRVSDTGNGIPPEILNRIFEPFFTTKGPDKGTGLGLSTVIGIVKGHNGFVQVSSKANRGTTFAVYLPADQAGVNETQVLDKAECTFRGNGETILVVDDESSVCDMVRAVLTELNFKVLTAADGTQALLQVADHRAELRTVITDVHMPYMDGLTFVRVLKQMLPAADVIVTSGRMEDDQAIAFKELGVTARLDKPYTQAALVAALKKILQG